MSDTLEVHSSHVQRDYVHGWFLSQLYSGSTLSGRLVLKGGNCLRKAYFEAARYSRDLDFSTDSGISNDQLASELNRICTLLQYQAGIEFDISRTLVQDKKRADADKKISEARLYFQDFYGQDSELVLSIRLDITQFDRRYLPIQQRNLIHPYSDAAACSTPIRCVKLEEILATKMRCLLQRKHIADLFDLVYATMINRTLVISRAELLSTFFRITVFSGHSDIVKALLIDLPLEAFRRFWTEFIHCPVASRLDFDQAKASFAQLVDLLIPGSATRAPTRPFSRASFETRYSPPAMRPRCCRLCTMECNDWWSHTRSPSRPEKTGRPESTCTHTILQADEPRVPVSRPSCPAKRKLWPIRPRDSSLASRLRFGRQVAPSLPRSSQAALASQARFHGVVHAVSVAVGAHRPSASPTV
jgi:predicted nucleotidyltransferase component of viral defense system